MDGQVVSGSLFDFALYLYHNATTLKAKGTGPYFYLPKLENHLEARLWNDVFIMAQRELGLPGRHGQGHGADRDHPRRLRDGRDPLRAARPYRRAQLRAVGLHLQLHQEVPQPARFRLARPVARDHDHALPAVVLAAHHQDLPPPRRLRDGGHGGTDSDQDRRRGQCTGPPAGPRRQDPRGRRRSRRHLGGPSRAGADRHGGLQRTNARAQSTRTGCATTFTSPRPIS